MKFTKKHSSSERNAASRKDLEKMERRLSRQRTSSGEGVARGTGRAIKMISRGIGNIGRSLASPNDNRRPRIAQMPGSRHEIGISQHANSDKLKAPGLRGKNISGRR